MIENHLEFWQKHVDSYELSDQDVELALWICCTVQRLVNQACRTFGEAAVDRLIVQFVHVLGYRPPLYINSDGVVDLAKSCDPYPDFNKVTQAIRRDLEASYGNPREH